MTRSICIILIFLPLFSFAQKDTVYLDGNRLVKDKSEAQYYMPPYVKEGDKYKVTSIFMNGQLKSEGYSRSFDTLIWDGPFTSYYANGRKESSGNYINGYQVGAWKTFYEDTSRVWAVSSFNPVADTLEVLRSFYRSGKLKRIEYKEKEKPGKLMNASTRYHSSGICYNESGEEIPFTPFEKMPEFKTDINRFLAKTMRYPAEAREADQQGRVNVRFTVDENGNVTDVVVINPSIDPSLMKEAIRVVKLSSGGWTPGKLDDKPVKVVYTLPVMFRLG